MTDHTELIATGARIAKLEGEVTRLDKEYNVAFQEIFRLRAENERLMDVLGRVTKWVPWDDEELLKRARNHQDSMIPFPPALARAYLDARALRADTERQVDYINKISRAGVTTNEENDRLRAENERLMEGIAHLDRYVDMDGPIHRMICALLADAGEIRPQRDDDHLDG